MAARGVLLTGLPGVGKTTACRRVAEVCCEQGFRVEGFLTEELRERGARVGFDVVELSSSGSRRRVPLARIGAGDGPRVGRYSVAVPEFESLALPVMERLHKVRPGEKVVCIVDEIGKMELFSRPFVEHVRGLLSSRPVPLLFTIALHGSGFIAEAKRIKGLELVEITHSTRSAAPADLVSRLLGGGTGRRVTLTPAAHLEGALGGTAEEAPSGDVSSSGQGAGRRWQRKERQSTEAATEATPLAEAARGGQVVLWFRSELRLADNPLVARAVQLCRIRGAALLPVFCLDPRDFGEEAQTAFGNRKVGALRRRFLEETLQDLAASLARRGSRLLVCEAAPEAALPTVASTGDVVLATREACPEERAAEARVRGALESAGASLELLDGGGITLVFGAGDLAAAGLPSGSSFPEDFRVFYNAVRNSAPKACLSGLSEAPAQLPPAGTREAAPLGLRKAEPAVVSPQLPEAAGPAFRGGETEAHVRLRTWLNGGGLRSYKATFRHLLGDYSSRLSAHLALGCLSPRRLCAEALAQVPTGPHVEHFVYELCWRDYFRLAAQRWGASLFRQTGPLGVARTWRQDDQAKERWKSGNTGVPLVDAAMRELSATGYMGNLARQFAASYFVEELSLDWREGADWFEACLIDYDPHSNWGQWARTAGVMPTTETKRQRVGGTRYYDIALDTGGAGAARYIRGWVPELSALPDAELLAPWRSAGAAAACGYPTEPLCSDALRRYFEVASLDGGKGRGKGRGGPGKGKGERRASGSGPWG